jgi:DNA replication protein DnaC
MSLSTPSLIPSSIPAEANSCEAQAPLALAQLGLNVAREHLDSACQRAAAEAWSYSHFLGYLLAGELQERHRKTVALNLQFARFPYLKRLEEFDFDAQPGLDRRLIEELATGRFLHEGRNIVFLGPPGVGKTHLAIALGVLTAELGHRVYFTSALEMARRLTKALAENYLHREMNNLTRPKLLIMDEVGYLKLEPAQASLLFQVICARYERQGALILTSNKAFGEWGEVFGGDAVMASAALDRLLHRATVINIRGESYRLKEKRQASGNAMSNLPSPPLKKSAPRNGAGKSREVTAAPP